MSRPAPDWVAYHACRSPRSLALESVDTGVTVTWAALDERVAAVTGMLAGRGVARGDRVVVVAENDLRVFELQFACMRLGAILAPLNWRLAPIELEVLAKDVDPSLIVHDLAWAEVGNGLAASTGAPSVSWGVADTPTDFDTLTAAAEPISASGARTTDDVTHILYTSGTTGHPKGALMTNGTLFWQWANTASVSALTGYGSKYLNTLPLFHAGGLTTLAAPIHFSGGCVTLARRFDPQQCLAWLSGAERGVTHFNGPPIMWQAMAELNGFTSAEFAALRHAHIAGSVMPLAMFATWADKGVGIQQHYGGTEMGPSVTALPEDDVTRKVGSCGLPVRHTEVRLVDGLGNDVADGVAGEVWLRGPSVTPGYWGRERDDEAFAGDWFRTGDAAVRDDEGYFYIADRLKDMFKSGGESVFPAEIERILMEMPAVAEVAVVGVPDSKWGEVGRAVVVPIPGATVTLDDVTATLAGRLARYKIPKSVVVAEALPRNLLGKLDKRELRARFGS